MTRSHSKGLVGALVLVVASMALGGCNIKHQRDMDILKGEKQALVVKNTNLQSQLSRAGVDNDALKAQLTDTKGTLGAKIKELQDKLASGAGGGSAIRLADGKTPLYYKTLGGDLLFSSGMATLTAGGQKALAGIVVELKAKHSGQVVRVYGYTDSDPIVKTRKLWKDNLDLSANRAMAVARYLISKGIKRDLVETVAMGASRPVDNSGTKAGKARNRRVEIVVVRK